MEGKIDILKDYPLRAVLLFCLLCCSTVYAQKQSGKSVAIPVDKVWSGHPVGFDIITTEKFQYICYYDTARNMVIAQRPLTSKDWKKTILPTKVKWDSHNYIDMILDKNGFIHVSGNMHGVPLIYFRSEKPENIEMFEKLSMTGKNEERATYPVFFKDQKGELYFQYRNGGSGDGITYWNKYSAESKTWNGLFDTPFFDGEKESNAYMSNPQPGPDGYFYIIWMWRLSPIANTNHNLSCIRSKDLLSWENMKGDKIALPVKWSDNKAVVDPVAPWNGLINMSFQISWDKEKVPYISYHKFDKSGVSQVFISRWEKGLWQTYQISSWEDFTWDLNRGGSLSNSVAISGVIDGGNSTVTARFMHEKYGSGSWVLDKNSLKVKETLPEKPAVAPAIPIPVLAKDMTLQRRMDNTGRFTMQWQTLPTFQDKPRPKPYPEPSDLVIYEVVEK
ncbi:BNR repeat-containing protein [Dyadobacter psychrotolerans]|uniref:Uncharacterized protein n=1 Tax=Dyadobacter psychrotolerans TaxID=2541721 RepID=A0A4R5DUC9_9BACT|nr:BNR repeat-containing protein [Dyadobacter psychrotolerans]TDE14543.1 hypothetical protein E0F88_15215 [Dyadobacter psychrotolerans]